MEKIYILPYYIVKIDRFSCGIFSSYRFPLGYNDGDTVMAIAIRRMAMVDE